jgi:hypothetical protein
MLELQEIDIEPLNWKQNSRKIPLYKNYWNQTWT